MQSLSLIKRILQILGLCPKDSNNSNYGRFMNSAIIILFVVFLLITVEYILSHIDDINVAIYALMQFVSFSTAWTCYMSFANQKHLTFKFLINLQKIVDDYSKYLFSSSQKFWLKTIHILYVAPIVFYYFFFRLIESEHGHYGFYEESEKKSHQITKWPLIIFLAQFNGVMLLSIINIIISSLLDGEMHPEQWYLFHKMR